MRGGLPHAQRILDDLIADPPKIHGGTATGGDPQTLWSTDESCYRFLAGCVAPGDRTLETGSGLSTALLAALGAQHTCVTPAADEVAGLKDYLAARAIPAEHLSFEIGSSDRVLPRLEGESDLVLIDGSHGFPLPIVDWFYAGGRLRQGGILVIDDVHLPAVGVLVAFLDRDPRWEPMQRTRQWAAFRRGGAGDLAEDWWQQPFHKVRPVGIRGQIRRVIAGLRRRLRRA
jgi:hypothetical protein